MRSARNFLGETPVPARNILRHIIQIFTDFGDSLIHPMKINYSRLFVSRSYLDETWYLVQIDGINLSDFC